MTTTPLGTRRIATRARLTPALVQSCARFGVVLDPTPRAIGHAVGPTPAAPSPAVTELARAMRPGQIALVTGPSGSGKSTTLAHLRAALHAAGHAVAPAPAPLRARQSVLDALGTDPRLALSILARAGLAEAALLPRLPAELSAGERARFDLARALHAALAAPDTWVLADEFVTALDRATAQGVCAGVTRWVRAVGARAGLRLVCASAHEDLPGLLGPDVLVRCALRPGLGHSPAAEVCPAPVAHRPQVCIEQGTSADLRALEHHHYRAGAPATLVRTLRADRTLADGSETLAGVLVVSMPTLNGSWRNLAWPGAYTGPDKRARAAAINAELRCVSRVIVEPASRGLGIGRMLVEEYLRDPLTVRTEALAAMGTACPFFARAGMREIVIPRSRRDGSLLESFQERGWSVATLLRPGQAERACAHEGVHSALSRWAAGSAATRRAWALVRAEPQRIPELLRAAACCALATPVGYAAG